MENLYVVEQGSFLAKSGDTLKIVKQGTVLDAVPAKDPVNALLSFVYTLLTNEVISAIKTCGLDPYLGSLHEISYGRPSLAWECGFDMAPERNLTILNW